MANVTFSAPTLEKDITVYAVAGDNKTLLGVAKQNNIPVPCQCQDGQCAVCSAAGPIFGDRDMCQEHPRLSTVDYTRRERPAL